MCKSEGAKPVTSRRHGLVTPPEDEGSVSKSHADDDGTSSTPHDGNVSNADNDEESAAPTTRNWVEATATMQETVAGEQPKALEGAAASHEKDQHEAVQDVGEVPEQHSAENNDAVRVAENGTHEETSAVTSTAAPGSQADGEGSVSADAAVGSTGDDDSGAGSDKAAAAAPDSIDLVAEAEPATGTQVEDADMVDAPSADTPTGEDGDEPSPISTED